MENKSNTKSVTIVNKSKLMSIMSVQLNKMKTKSSSDFHPTGISRVSVHPWLTKKNINIKKNLKTKKTNKNSKNNKNQKKSNKIFSSIKNTKKVQN